MKVSDITEMALILVPPSANLQSLVNCAIGEVVHEISD